MYMLCKNYKILTKILANRPKHILPEIISEEQNCLAKSGIIFKHYFLNES